MNTPPTEDITVADGPDARRHSDRQPEPPATGAESDTRVSPRGAGGSVVVSPLDALRADERARSRSLAIVAMVLVAGAAGALPLLGGDPIAIRVAIVSMAVMMVTNAALFFWLGSPTRYSDERSAVVWAAATLAALGIVYYFGAFSAAVVVVFLGLYFIALGQSFRIALMVYVTIAAGHGVIAVSIAFGLLTDRGLLTSESISSHIKVISALLLQGVFMSGFFLARRSRRAMLDAVQDLHDAVREVAQREVLLEEARQDFARAARIGGPGRLTGATVGDFELGVILGRGAMGEVYEARHVEAGTPAAVKVLLPSTGSQPGSLSRFFRELEVAAGVQSPHVVRVLQVADADASIPFLAMELLRGSDLSSYLRERGRLDIGEAVDLVRQVGRGLTDAAAAGVVHRDLKPQNLFRVEADDGRAVWKILDFGVSKIAGHSGTLTQGKVVGTPVYMAPEQALGAAVDHRADLYALAAIAYRCLTGRPPFKGGDVAAILYAVVNVMPAAPGRLADLPQLDRVFERALAKDPEQRFQSADELAQALWRAGTRAHG